ncbi:MAG: hypothetical protein O2788_02620 [Chloroflexi bacterium]|nr:hypothetical protein [Chloroflexota bacterium]
MSEVPENSIASNPVLASTGISNGRSPLGKTEQEDEADHLRRVAEELGGASAGSVSRLADLLSSRDEAERRAAAASLGAISDRHAIGVLRGLLESDVPANWELAVHGLRQSRTRDGWLCLESVALDHVPALEASSSEVPHAYRLLVMGRTKTMDRLFRAIDGHSRSISSTAAINFTKVAVRSVPEEMAVVMAMRLGLVGGVASTPEVIATATNQPVEEVRRLEALAWETVQRSRTYSEIRRNFEVTVDRLWIAD